MNNRKYAIRFSAHNSNYLPLKPKIFNLTLNEAKKQVEEWQVRADTVGGDAIIVEIKE